MKRLLIALLPMTGVFALALPASAQPYPGLSDPAPAVEPGTLTVSPLDGGTTEPAPAPTVYAPNDPNYDTDPDIDGYDAEYDVYYDNVAAQGYDDGYNPTAYTQFESQLSPYGTWIDDPSYGRVWAPSSAYVGTDFFPYSTGGHWVLTDYGWTWVSDWNWGWGPFHYGRWTSISGRGWCWIPGTVWGPAWVSWRSGGGYVGWSPLPPSGVRIGPPGGVRSSWRFTLANQLGSARPSYLPARTVPSIFARTSVITNLRSVPVGSATVRVNAGPTLTAAGAGLGSTLPASLRTVAPNSLPQAHIAPRTGVPLSQRPWVQRGVGVDPGRRPSSIPIGPRTYNGGPQPIYNNPRPIYQPRNGSLQVYTPSREAPVTPPRPLQYAPQNQYTQPRPIYNPPSYQQPQPSYQPRYNAPQPSYQAPQPSYQPRYNAPQPSYQPHYSAPAPSYQPRSYSAPSPSYSPRTFSAPSPAPSRPSYSAPSMHSAPMMRGGGGRR